MPRRSSVFATPMISPPRVRASAPKFHAMDFPTAGKHDRPYGISGHGCHQAMRPAPRLCWCEIQFVFWEYDRGLVEGFLYSRPLPGDPPNRARAPDWPRFRRENVRRRSRALRRICRALKGIPTSPDDWCRTTMCGADARIHLFHGDESAQLALPRS